MNRIVIAVNVLLGFAPSLLEAQPPQQKPLKVVETHVLVFQADVRSKAGAVTEKRFIPAPKSRKYYELNGTLEAFDREAVVIIPLDKKKERYVVPWSVISTFEIKHERKSRAGTGALVGLLVGGTAGGIIGSQTQWCILTCGPATDFGLVIGSVGGLFVGVTVGAIIGSDYWERLPLDDYQVLKRKILGKR